MKKDIQQEAMPQSTIESVLPAARNIAVLFGFTSTKWTYSLIRIRCGNDAYSVEKKMLPNSFSKMYVINMNGIPVGSVLFVEIATNILHMVGMFVAEECRGKKIEYSEGAKECRQTVATFLLQHVMNDLMESNCLVTLEVMNNNQSAYKLYERGAFFAKDIMEGSQFELCTKTEAVEYAKIRRKKIKKWHDIGRGESREGIQWSHIPDYNGESTWSISRVYYLPSGKQRLTSESMAFTKNKLKLIYSVLRFGHIFKFIKYIVASS